MTRPPPIILVVDDDADAQRLLRDAFAQADARVRVLAATSGADALRYLDRAAQGPITERPRLMLLDQALPHIDGFQVLELVKRDPAWKDLPIAILGVSDSEADRKRARAAGASAFLARPDAPARYADLARNLAGYVRMA